MRKTIIRFFTIADYEDEEIWLRHQHRQGWKLVHLTVPCFYEFESCQPQDVIYRLDYKNAEQTEEYMQMVRDFGWEYFAHCMGWLYFRKPADAAEAEGEEEIFSDNESRLEMVSSIVYTRLLPLCMIFVCCLLPNLMKAIRGEMNIAGGFFAALFGLLFAIYVILIIHCSVKLKAIRDKYQN